MSELKLISTSEKDTKALGVKLAHILPDGSTIALLGDLGAGKTTLTRGVAEGLEIKEVVQSPTFNIMKIYLKGNRPLIHIDAYRLADLDTDIGLDEYIGYETGITMIEWPLYIEKLLPKNTIYVEIKHLGEDKRDITIRSGDEKIIEALK